jgi:hypothetical protein
LILDVLDLVPFVLQKVVPKMVEKTNVVNDTDHGNIDGRAEER